MAEPRDIARVGGRSSRLWARADELERINLEALRARLKVLMVRFSGTRIRGMAAGLEVFRASVEAVARTLPEDGTGERGMAAFDAVLKGADVRDKEGLGLARGLAMVVIAAERRGDRARMNAAAAAVWMANPDARETAECGVCLCAVPATEGRRDWRGVETVPSKPLADSCPECGAAMANERHE